LTALVTAILVAATAPVESVLPCAVRHRPTVAAAEVADCVVVILVAEVRVTVLFVVVPGLAAGLAPAPAPKLRDATTMVEPETDTTEPVAKAPVRVEPPDGAPEGRAKLPDGRGRAWKLDPADGMAPPKPAPNPPVQRPLTGWLTVTAVAVNEVAVAEPEVVVAVTQSPALTALAARVTCWVNFVVVVQVTAI
jgi:hypothetical protein